MARIPTFTRRVLPSGRVGGVEIPTDIADIGEGIEAQGLAALGKGISGLGDALARINLAEGVSQASTAIRQAGAEFKLLEENLKDNNDTDTYQPEFEKFLQIVEGLRPKSSIGSKRFDDFLEMETNVWRTGVDILSLRKKRDIIQGDYVTNRAAAITARDSEEADRLTTEARDVTFAISHKQAAKDLVNNKIAIDKIFEADAISAVHAAIELASNPETGTGNFGIAKDLAKSPLISEPKQTTLRKAIQSAETSAGNKGVTLQQTAIDLTYNNIVEKLSDDLDSVDLSSLDDVLAPLPEGDKQIIEGVFNHRASELQKGNQDPFTIKSDEAFAVFMRTIEEDARAVSPSKIFSFIGNGLTPDDFVVLNNFRTFALRKDNPLLQPAVAEAFQIINDVIALEGKPTTPEEVVLLRRKQNQAKQEIIDLVQSGIKGDELKSKVEQAVAPVTESAVGNWLGSWWRAHMPQSLILPNGHAGWWWDWHEKPGTRFRRPGNLLEFEAFTDQIGREFGDTEGEAFYDLWKGDFE